MRRECVAVGDAACVGRDARPPYLYQTDDAMFMVITDDEAWAKDAIAQLP